MNDVLRLPIPDVPRRQVRDGARLAIQSALAAAVAYGSLLALGLPERFVGVLAAVLVIQPSVGDTVGEAIDRVLATLVGAAVGVACMLLLPRGYGTAVALALSMFVMSAIAAWRPQWRYGVVAAVALALGDGDDVLAAARERAVSIALGAAVGALVTVLVWPESAADRAKRHLGRALEATADRMDAALAGVQGDEGAESERARKRFHAAFEDANAAAQAIGDDEERGDSTRRVEHVERLYNSVLFIDRIAGRQDELEDRLPGPLTELRDLGRQVVRGLAESGGALEGDGAEALASFRELLEEAEAEAASEQKPDGPRRTGDALLFALGEVERELVELAGKRS